MPTTSVIVAAQSKYASLTASNFPDSSRPTLYFDSAPVYDSAQVYPPYVVLVDLGLTPTYLEFERTTLEVNNLAFEIYYPELGDCDTAGNAIKLNGGTRNTALGFDFGDLSDLGAPRDSYQVLRTSERRSVAGYGKPGPRVHLLRIEYRVTVKESP